MIEEVLARFAVREQERLPLDLRHRLPGEVAVAAAEPLDEGGR